MVECLVGGWDVTSEPEPERVSWWARVDDWAERNTERNMEEI